MTFLQDIDTGVVTLVDPRGNQNNQPVSVTERLANPATVNIQFTQNGSVIGLSSVAIVSASVANPSVITTASAHGLTTGATVTISGCTGSTPTINGSFVATVTGTTTFTIPVNVTVAPTTYGTEQPASPPISFWVKQLYSDTTATSEATSFTLSGSGSSSLYSSTLDLSTTQCYALFSGGTADSPSSALISAIDWQQISDTRAKEGNLISFTLQNRVGGGASPTPSPGSAVTYANAQGLVILLPGITGYTGGASNDLDSVPTTTLLVPWEARMYDSAGSAVKSVYLRAGTDAPVAGMITRPVDYNAVTNAKVWVTVG